MIILMFFVLGALLIVSNNNFALSEPENLAEFGDLYIDWLDKTFFNVKSITGYATGLKWVPS